MSTSFCEKDCHGCSRYVDSTCPGCAEDPGKTLSTQCSIAVCARQKGKKFCSDCTFRSSCDHYAKRHTMALLREEKFQADQQKREFSLRNVSQLAGCYWALALLSVFPSIIASILSALGGQVLSSWIQLFSFIFTGIVVLRMSKADLSYRTAAILLFVEAGIAALTLWTCAPYYSYDMAPMWKILFPASSVASIFRMYYLCQGHTDTLLPVDRNLSDKWASLWQTFKWTMIILAVSSFLIIVISSVIFAFLFAISCIFIIILYVMEIVYLFRTAIAAGTCKKQLETEFP